VYRESAETDLPSLELNNPLPVKIREVLSAWKFLSIGDVVENRRKEFEVVSSYVFSDRES
jgi:hypothetical protein